MCCAEAADRAPLVKSAKVDERVYIQYICSREERGAVEGVPLRATITLYLATASRRAGCTALSTLALLCSALLCCVSMYVCVCARRAVPCVSLALKMAVLSYYYSRGEGACERQAVDIGRASERERNELRSYMYVSSQREKCTRARAKKKDKKERVVYSTILYDYIHYNTYT